MAEFELAPMPRSKSQVSPRISSPTQFWNDTEEYFRPIQAPDVDLVMPVQNVVPPPIPNLGPRWKSANEEKIAISTKKGVKVSTKKVVPRLVLPDNIEGNLKEEIKALDLALAKDTSGFANSFLLQKFISALVERTPNDRSLARNSGELPETVSAVLAEQRPRKPLPPLPKDVKKKSHKGANAGADKHGQASSSAGAGPSVQEVEVRVRGELWHLGVRFEEVELANRQDDEVCMLLRESNLKMKHQTEQTMQCKQRLFPIARKLASMNKLFTQVRDAERQIESIYERKRFKQADEVVTTFDKLQKKLGVREVWNGYRFDPAVNSGVPRALVPQLLDKQKDREKEALAIVYGAEFNGANGVEGSPSPPGSPTAGTAQSFAGGTQLSVNPPSPANMFSPSATTPSNPNRLVRAASAGPPTPNSTFAPDSFMN